MGRKAAAFPLEALRAALKSQYHASLTMLRDAIRTCPEGLWTVRGRHANPFWRIAYHTLYYTHLYLQANNRVFRPWEHNQRGIHRMSAPIPSGAAGGPAARGDRRGCQLGGCAGAPAPPCRAHGAMRGNHRRGAEGPLEAHR